MDGGMRSGARSEIVVKKRNSSGCLIVRKKSGGGVGSSSSSGFRKEKKRLRPVVSDSESGSSDEILLPATRRRGVNPETVRICNGLSGVEEGGYGRRERFRGNGGEFVGRNGEGSSEGKGSKLDVFEFDEYEGFNDSRRRLLGSMNVGRSGREREFERSSGRNVVADERRKIYVDRRSSLDRESQMVNGRLGMRRDKSRLPVSGRKFLGHLDEPIRVQGKNGVLKVMVNKNKNAAGSMKRYDQPEYGESRKISVDIVKRNLPAQPPLHSEASMSVEKRSSVGKEKQRKSLPVKSEETSECESEDSDMPPKLKSKKLTAQKSTKLSVREDDKTPSSGKLPPSSGKKGQVRRGTGTEKQKLREHIRGMLLSAGWTIDYRPRRNRDYLDAVYINPSGTAYWSIIKAYDAFQKQLNEDDDTTKPGGDGSLFSPIPDEALNQLTRKTQKKMEREMKKQQRDARRSDRARAVAIKKTPKSKHYMESGDSDSQEEKLSSSKKYGGKCLRNRKDESIQEQYSAVERSASNVVQGRRSNKLGRCTLLVRNSNKGMNDSDGYVPYTGKRTLLSWLIDSVAVQLRQKVQYMNRRRTKVMLEGWVTRDGIHCGCCSKILTLSKFEIHAGSKLRQPYQNIYLESGASLLQCEIDAWKQLEQAERIGFCTVENDGDDPNDDTCGICGDGGDLICCDGCPSTFHQTCLDIKMLPPGDWHCPNCTCKICEVGKIDDEENNRTVCALLTCSMCEKKYHEACVTEMGVDYSGPSPSFCGHQCKELFEHVQKYLGVKHELESGYSWSLIRRTDDDADTFLRGPQRVECNAKLAVALNVMDECFLPIVDRRSGINLIHNVLYNCGSNFNRLNYCGFYTAVLERGDEIISAASLRFHGSQLAEMPFIGTRNIYRRQGMCRRLFSALEKALCNFKVEKLIIPAVAELTHTWTVIFGFSPLEDSVRHVLRSINMLVFPGIDMLQKQLLQQQEVEISFAHDSDMEVEDKCEISSAHLDPEKSENATMDCESKSQGTASVLSDMAAINSSLDVSHEVKTTVSIVDAAINSSLDASHEVNTTVSIEDAALNDEGDRVAESAIDGFRTHHIDEAKVNKVPALVSNSQCPDAPSGATAAVKSLVCSPASNTHLVDDLPESASNKVASFASKINDDKVKMESKTLSTFIIHRSHFSEEFDDMNVAHKANGSLVEAEPVCSSGKQVAHNIFKKNDESAKDVPVSSSPNACGSSTQMDSDLTAESFPLGGKN